MKEFKDIVYYLDNKLDILTPDDGESFKTIIYFHGGGLKEGDKYQDNIVSMEESFTKNGYIFVSVNYRMYPNAKFPDYLIDAANSVKYIKDNIKKYNGSGEVIITGQSAGAYISLMLAVNKEYLESVNIDSSTDIDGWIIESAETTTHFNVLALERNLDYRLQRIDEAAPIYYLNENTNFKRMLLIYYSDDMICRKPQNILFYEVLKMFNENIDITPLELEGWHCKGSSIKDSDNEYPYVKESLKWLNKK